MRALYWEVVAETACAEAKSAFIGISQAFLAGQTERVWELIPGVDLDVLDAPLQREFFFLAGLAARRLDRADEGKVFWERAKELMPLDRALLFRIGTEQAATHMNRGLFNEALQEVRKLPHGQAPDGYTGARLAGIAATCHAYLGTFTESLSWFDKEESITAKLQLDSLTLAFLCRKVLFYCEKNDRDAAAVLVEKALPLAWSSVNSHAFLLKMQARVHLLAADLHNAKAALERFEEFASEHSIPESFISVVEERCELNLIATAEMDAIPLQELLVRARRQGNIYDECIAQMQLASGILQMLAKEKQRDPLRLELARAHSDKALEIAQSQHYGALQVRCLLLAGSLAAHLGKLVESRSHLDLAGRLSQNFPALNAAATLTISSFTNGPQRAKLVEEVLSGRMDLALVSASLKKSSLRPAITFLVRFMDSGEEGSGDFFQLASLLRDSQKILWLRNQDTLLFWQDRQVASLQLDNGQQADRGALVLLRHGEQGISISQFHFLVYGQEYDIVRHEQKVKVLLGRARKKLSAAGVQIVFARGEKAYRLSTSTPLLDVALEEPVLGEETSE